MMREKTEDGRRKTEDGRRKTDTDHQSPITNHQSPMAANIRIKTILGINLWYFLAFFFILASGYFFFFGNHILFFQEQQSLFIYTSSYFIDFLVRPGGLLDLTGRFFTQFYISKLIGSIILAFLLTLTGIMLLYINKRLLRNTAISNLLLMIPCCLLLLMQTHYYHMALYDLGFLLILIYFLFLILSEKKFIRYLLLALFPLFFYLTSAYAVIFLCMFVVYGLFYVKGPEKYYYVLLLVIETVISAFVFKEFLLLQTYKQLVLFPLPFINDPTYKILFWILTVYIIFYPAICRLSNNLRKSDVKIEPAGIISSILVFVTTVVMLITGYNSQDSRVINLEKLVFEEKWDQVIEFQEKYPSMNMIGEYFYNIALSETDQLCDRLFYSSQDFGTGTLILKWSSEYLNWGAYSFYTTGLINEAQRWAYEEMVVYGCRPQNMKLLTKASLISGNYPMAEKYAGILNKTLFYNGWAKEYARMVQDTSLIESHPDLAGKRMILPQEDFFIYLESPEGNLPMMVDQNPGNRRAFEYMMAWLMLGKNVDILVNNIRLMKNMGYTRIPRHIEEAIMIYYNSQGVFPDLGGLPLSSETRIRFNQYFTAYVTARQNPSTLKEKMQKQFSNTFWYYYHFK